MVDTEIAAGPGADSVSGDVRYIHSTNNTAPGLLQGGNDTLDGGTENDTLYGDARDLIAGDNNDSSLSFQGGDDTINGGAGNDTIYGDLQILSVQTNTNSSLNFLGGDDVIDGGSGNDNLYGDVAINSVALGNSVTYVGGNGTFVLSPGSGVDTIRDFEAGKDLLDISGYGVTAATFATWETSHISGNIVDFDGTASVVDQVTIMGVTGLAIDDFLLA